MIASGRMLAIAMSISCRRRGWRTMDRYSNPLLLARREAREIERKGAQVGIDDAGEDFLHGRVGGAPLAVAISGECRQQVVLALAREPRHLSLALELRQMALAAMQAARERGALLHRGRIGRRRVRHRLLRAEML